MKIDPRTLDPASASQAGKTQETTSVSSSDRRSGAGRAGADSDRVDLSDLSGLLLERASAEPPERAARVEQLAAEVRSGRYKVDAEEVSRRIIAEAAGQ
ncbi:MAG: flagellar biosynthesis anti-sigma factor FlgM [Acidobacteriota bacterium]